MKTFLYLRTLLSQFNKFIYENSKDPFKSVAHFFRSGAVSLMMLALFSIIALMVMKFAGQATNWTFFDALVEFFVGLVLFFVSKSFIKEEVE